MNSIHVNSGRGFDLFCCRNDTLQKWYDKTRLLGGKLSSKSFSGFEQSAVKQIEQVRDGVQFV